MRTSVRMFDVRKDSATDVLRRFRLDYLQQVRNRQEDLSIVVASNAGDAARSL